MKITVEYDVKCPNCEHKNFSILPQADYLTSSLKTQMIVECPKCHGIWDIGKVSGTYKILNKEISWKNHENLHQ